VPQGPQATDQKSGPGKPVFQNNNVLFRIKAVTAKMDRENAHGF